jgi:hypothetical protein
MRGSYIGYHSGQMSHLIQDITTDHQYIYARVTYFKESYAMLIDSGARFKPVLVYHLGETKEILRWDIAS